MYIPSYFELQDNRAFALIDTYSFATLVSQHRGELFATHVPLLVDRDSLTLWGHVARTNPQWHDLESQQILAIFVGDHAYISPSWYESQDNVPTWNYSAVHVYGRIELDRDPAHVVAMLGKLIDKYEAVDSGYSIDSVDTENLADMLGGIVAFRIHIDRIEGKAKMSQNHPQERRDRVSAALEGIGSDAAIAVSAMMQASQEE
jgi:transcriptional regulator